jgi:hypothetical protein
MFRLFVAAAVLLTAAPAEARELTIRGKDAPELTLTVPAGWKASERRSVLVLTRRDGRIVVRQCRLPRSQRDMTGRNTIPRDAPRRAPGVYGSADSVAVAVPGGTCLGATGRGAAAVAARLHPELGPGTPAPASDPGAERFAREARRRTLDRSYAQGTAVGVPFDLPVRIESTWEWSLPAGYVRQVQRYVAAGGNSIAELIRQPGDDFVREEQACWGGTSEAESDDALEPRLELHDWDAPPSTRTAWRVAYAPPETLPDGATRVRWTGFVAGGEAVIGPDGLLRRVRIDDHRQAYGRAAWRTVEIAFAGFPAAVTPARPEPLC